jgi:hypothetical protein
MNKIEFLNDNDTVHFTEWLGEVIAGTRELQFTHAPGGADATLGAAKERYCWPNRRTEIETPDGSITLIKNSSLQRNQEVLDQLSKGIRECLEAKPHDEEALAGWVKAIMVWGGVYTMTKNGGGNAGWLDGKRESQSLAGYLTRILQTLSDSSGDLVNPEEDLRSNAATTKVHALILPDFVIYDSRVAAALAWLVKRWASQNRKSPIAQHLRFACMRAKTTLARPKTRTPDRVTFPYFAATGHIRNHRRHATWNLRANWVLRQALDNAINGGGAGSAINFQSVREVEAALFMIGENLEYARAAA